ncbi:hypothetical protein [Pannonibacter sp.]|uniref:hypothetical protein n=1 Tax=Pannonibacter sp. TaxID=1906786 RepID=UPI003F6E9009
MRAFGQLCDQGIGRAKINANMRQGQLQPSAVSSPPGPGHRELQKTGKTLPLQGILPLPQLPIPTSDRPVVWQQQQGGGLQGKREGAQGRNDVGNGLSPKADRTWLTTTVTHSFDTELS